MIKGKVSVDLEAIMPKNRQGPQFIQWLDPVLKALKELGGSGRPAEVVEIVARLKNVPDVERQETLQGGRLRFDNQVAFARQYLVWDGYLDSSKRGVWTLTEKGRSTAGLSEAESLQLFKRQWKLHRGAEEKEEEEDDEPLEVPDGYKEKLLEILRDMPPAAFERLCRRLLSESGFEKVHVSGRPGDGGIDGIGVVKVNPFVAFKVLFQCKRYSGPVGCAQVREFRGAMQGSADKGIILTTSRFTKDAETEAVKDGAPPIELVDGDELVLLLEKFKLGLIPRTTYDVDIAFFEQFDVDAELPADDDR